MMRNFVVTMIWGCVGLLSFAARAAAEPSLTASPGTLASGGTVTVTWSDITNPTSRDWIGLYRLGWADTAYLSFQYVNCSQTPGATPRASGSCTFGLGGSGNYEFRYFRNNGFIKVVTSNPVTVGATGTLPTVSIQATTATAAEGEQPGSSP